MQLRHGDDGFAEFYPAPFYTGWPQRNIDAAQMLVHCQRRSLSIVAEVMSSSPDAISARPLLAASVAPYALGCDERSTHANIQHVENPRRGCHVVESSRPILRWYPF